MSQRYLSKLTSRDGELVIGVPAGGGSLVFELNRGNGGYGRVPQTGDHSSSLGLARLLMDTWDAGDPHGMVGSILSYDWHRE